MLDIVPISIKEPLCQGVEQDQPFPEVKEHLMKCLETRLDLDGVSFTDTESRWRTSTRPNGDEELDWTGIVEALTARALAWQSTGGKRHP